MTVQRFTLIGDRIPGGYDTVAICWCAEHVAVAALNSNSIQNALAE